MEFAVLRFVTSAMENSGKLEAKYANFFQIGQNSIDFIIEFGQLYSEDPPPLLHTRIITNPVYAKDLLHLLQEAIKAHEDQFGEIPCSRAE